MIKQYPTLAIKAIKRFITLQGFEDILNSFILWRMLMDCHGEYDSVEFEIANFGWWEGLACQWSNGVFCLDQLFD